MRRPPPAHAPAGLRASRGPVLAQESRPAARRRAPTPPASRAAGSPRLCRQESAGEWGAPPRAGHRRPRATGPHPPLARPPAACSRLAAAGSNWRRREREGERERGGTERGERRSRVGQHGAARRLRPRCRRGRCIQTRIPTTRRRPRNFRSSLQLDSVHVLAGQRLDLAE